LRDHTRYLHPRYAKATRCAQRAASLVHPWLRRLAFSRCPDPLARAERLAGLTRRVEAALPEVPAIAVVVDQTVPDRPLVPPHCPLRAASHVHPWLRRLAFSRCPDPLARAERLAGLTRRVEAALPEDPAIAEVIDQTAPDLLLVTPLIDFGSSQVDYIKAASR